ncbi:FeoC-like transcriptional regulator [Prosthecochloris sp. CIB 2401]|uniref:FeoC-like transcriptional regulator n=1 Tax=Prosthecochloris sp. CIB 2401 TaxID=1868325 RepID=UPI00138FE697|nr:FeoC-like transcriptional regulator [Prosthecochloris sp. CIB 2401]
MLPVKQKDITTYLQQKGISTLKELSDHFAAGSEELTHILDEVVAQGFIYRYEHLHFCPGTHDCCCSGKHPDSHIWYEWNEAEGAGGKHMEMNINNNLTSIHSS